MSGIVNRSDTEVQARQARQAVLRHLMCISWDPAAETHIRCAVQ